MFKIGHAHSGSGKARVENVSQFQVFIIFSPRCLYIWTNLANIKIYELHSDVQDMTSVIAIADTYCTVEPYIESKFDLHIQKIGSSYKALM